MVDIVRSLEQAEEWFLRNHDGEVTCRLNGQEKSVGCYPEARDFFAIHAIGETEAKDEPK